MKKYFFLKVYFTCTFLILALISAFAQEVNNQSEKKLLPKVEHAEPLYNDLMRDLGARKGEAEINIGMGLADHTDYIEHFGFVEYEWAFANRLGVEVEIPFSFNRRIGPLNAQIPNNRIEGVKLASQYTYYVNEKTQTSMAVAYVHEFELNYLNKLDEDRFFTGMRMNPLLIIAKKFQNLNTIIFGGPVIKNKFETGDTKVSGTVNASVLYQLQKTKNFIGIENNFDFRSDRFNYVIRPQVKVGILHNLAIGLVTGIPITSVKEMRLDFLTRIIWEP